MGQSTSKAVKNAWRRLSKGASLKRWVRSLRPEVGDIFFKAAMWSQQKRVGR